MVNLATESTVRYFRTKYCSIPNPYGIDVLAHLDHSEYGMCKNKEKRTDSVLFTKLFDLFNNYSKGCGVYDTDEGRAKYSFSLADDLFLACNEALTESK